MNELTAQDLNTLRRPFAYADHEFLRDYVYITEEAICERLEEVDPAWNEDIVEIRHRDNQIVVTMRMTVKGVSRVGVGMQTILSAGEAEKAAATDALKRCARLFGVGRYLLGAPEKAKFTSWLANKQREHASVNQQTGEIVEAPKVVQKAAPPVDNTPKATEPPTDEDPLQWVDDMRAEGAEITPLFFVTDHVSVKKTGNRKTLVFQSKEGELAQAYSRDPLRGVVDDEVIERIANPGKYDFGKSLKVYWKQSDKGYRTVEKVEAA